MGVGIWPKDLMASYIVVMVAADNITLTTTLRICRRRKKKRWKGLLLPFETSLPFGSDTG